MTTEHFEELNDQQIIRREIMAASADEKGFCFTRKPRKQENLGELGVLEIQEILETLE